MKEANLCYLLDHKTNVHEGISKFTIAGGNLANKVRQKVIVASSVKTNCV
jgi:hypothetical protein